MRGATFARQPNGRICSAARSWRRESQRHVASHLGARGPDSLALPTTKISKPAIWVRRSAQRLFCEQCSELRVSAFRRNFLERVSFDIVEPAGLVPGSRWGPPTGTLEPRLRTGSRRRQETQQVQVTFTDKVWKIQWHKNVAALEATSQTQNVLHTPTPEPRRT